MNWVETDFGGAEGSFEVGSSGRSVVLKATKVQMNVSTHANSERTTTSCRSQLLDRVCSCVRKSWWLLAGHNNQS